MLFTIFAIAIGGPLALVFLVVLLGAAGQPQANRERKKLAAELEAKVQSLSTVAGFEPVVVHAGGAADYGIALDPASEQFAIAITGHPPRLYHFSQLVGAEIEKDGHTVTTTEGKVDMKGAAIATALVGPIGLAAGAKTSSTSTTTTTITKLALKLYVNDLYTPCYEILFYQGHAGSPASVANMKEAATKLDAWFGRLRTILVGIERQGTAIDASKAIRHDGPVPQPAFTQLGWAARTFSW